MKKTCLEVDTVIAALDTVQGLQINVFEHNRRRVHDTTAIESLTQ